MLRISNFHFQEGTPVFNAVFSVISENITINN